MKIAILAIILLLYTLALTITSYKIGYVAGVCEVLQSLMENEQTQLDPFRVTREQAKLARFLQG